MYRMVGPRIFWMFTAALPLGLALGGLEIALAYILLTVLQYFQLMPPAPRPSWLPQEISPIILLVGSAALTTAMRYSMQALPNIAHGAFECRMRHALISETLQSSGEASRLSLTETTYIATQLASKSGGFVQALVTLSSTLTLMGFIAVNLVIMSWSLTTIVAGAIVFSGIPLWLMHRLARPLIDRNYHTHREYSDLFIKDIRNAQFLKFSGCDTIEANRLKDIAKHYKETHKSYHLILSLISNFPFFVGTCLVLLVLFINEHYSIVTAPHLIPFIYLLNRAAGTTSSLSHVTSNMREYVPYVRALAAYLDILFPQHQQNGSAGTAVLQAPPSLLEVSNLVYGRQNALSAPLTFSAQSGDMVLIAGPSGKGKTTLLLTLVGMVPRLGGIISWNKEPIDHLDGAVLRSRIGYAGPEPYLLDDTILANLLFGLDSRAPSDIEISNALHIASADFVYTLDGGLSHRLRDNGDGISAGQKQRIALARCILREPDILLLDEATSNIDDATEKNIIEKIKSHLPQAIILAISHRPTLRPFATKTIDL